MAFSNISDGVHTTAFKNLLLCPVCQENLEFLSEAIQCKKCNTQFRQLDPGWINLFPLHWLLQEETTHWEERQKDMEAWYQDLVSSPANAESCLSHDYSAYADYLATLSGRILDIGGGVGLVRHYLDPQKTEYIVVDPGIEWLRSEWSSLAESFPCLATKPLFVRGVGEYLPFKSNTFDVLLSFWSLNHASKPERVFQEAARVLKPGGTFFLVLEDMIPKWHELLDRGFPAEKVWESLVSEDAFANSSWPRLQILLRLLQRSWPLQADHLRIHESEIYTWSKKKFSILHRQWTNQFLTFKLQKHNSFPS